MAVIGYPEFLLLLLIPCILVFCSWKWSWSSRSGTLQPRPTNWPLVGMLPELLRNAHHLHEYCTQCLKQSGGTFEWKGPWFTHMDLMVTADPANVHHVLSKNYSNYPKGPQFRKIFEVLGDGIFNAESELGEKQRRITMLLLNHPGFKDLVESASWHKVEKGLIPVLDHFSALGNEVDLQELLQRFSFDCIILFLQGHDPSCLSLTLPHVPCEKAFGDSEKALLHRHLLPESCWKLKKWLQIGSEKKLSKAWASVDHFLWQCISMIEQEQASGSQSRAKAVHDGDYHGMGFKFLPEYVKAYQENYGIPSGGTYKFTRDTTLNLMLAGRETISAGLTWFFWLIATNPLAEAKIVEEIKAKMQLKAKEPWRAFNSEESKKLVYLQGALCESLRLFPPVPFQHKAPLRPDILPSGHRIGPKTKAVLSFYAMGRMESIWGKDCLEFKPERWIIEQGGIKNEPSNKFTAFNAGPKSCSGKELTFVQMKIVAATVIYNYQIRVAEGHPVSPADSVILHMKYGLKVRVSKRGA